jgi:tetratricopeptide (TPR) repeat protein
VYALFVQAPSDIDPTVIREVCERAGMMELPEDQVLALLLLKEAVRRLDANRDQPWTAWMLSDAGGEAWAQNAMPRAISAVVRKLQKRAPGVRTLSTTLSADQMAMMGQSIHELSKHFEQEMREVIRAGRASAADFRQLAVLLMNQGKLAEAEQKARAAVAAEEDSAEGWEVLGRILVRRDEFGMARDALDRSLDLDPTSVLNLHLLAFCYEQLGDSARADEFRMRAISLSGGQLP